MNLRIVVPAIAPLLAGFALQVFVVSAAQAFPENVRHGYVNCTSCHVSPSGGGALTPYGRSLSSELMSTWSYKNEEGFLHGAIKEDKMPEWLMIGGDLRGVQTHADTPQFTEDKFYNMQEDIEVAVRKGIVTLDLEYGHIEDPGNPHWGSRRYYAMVSITDEWTVRVGRFFPQFGLNIPDHYVPTRRSLGFDSSQPISQERNAIEAAWNGENWSAFATVSQMPGEIAVTRRETGTSLQLNRNLGDSSKVGASVWYGSNDQMSREMFGVHGILGFTKTLFLLSEFDHQWSDPKPNGAETRGFFAFNRLGFEFHKGLIAFLQAEYSQSNLSSNASATDAYGPGLQFFPRPHFEFEGVWRKTRNRVQGADFTDYGFLFLHYYF